MIRRPGLRFLTFLLVFVAIAYAEEEVKGESNATPTQQQEEKPKNADTDAFDADNQDWGTYHDPLNIFCGKYDCYKILGFDYENFGSPDTKEITKRYRQLSRVWHPDKSKHKNAKERFVKIARAYEVLTNEETRKEYDFMRYDPERYFDKYGTSVLWSYAPKSDVTLVLLIILVIGNIFSWYSQKHRWQLVADRLIKAAVEDWAASQGGTSESKELREHALAILAEKEKKNAEEVPANTPTQGKKKGSKKGGKRLSGSERRKQEQEALLPIVTELVDEMDDFGGGFHKPTWRDLLIVSLVKMPYKVTTGIAWQTKYWIRRLQKKELNDEERRVLTERAVGPVTWDTSTEDEKKEMIKRELWNMDNLIEWKEEQEIKNLSAADQKYYMKLKKKGKLDEWYDYE